MRTLIRLGLCAVTLAALKLAATGCSNNSMTSGADLATPSGDMASGNDQGFMLPDLGGPLADLYGDPVIRVSGGFAQPFGAIFDQTTNAWYVSNVAGNLSNPQNLKDGVGWITKISADYQTVDHTFYTTGLNAPAGLRIANGMLYVPDVDALVVVNIANRTGVRSGTVASAGFYIVMTDVDVDSSGNAYVAEPGGSRILKFATPTTAGSQPTSYTATGVSFGTTLLIDGTSLVVGTTGNPLLTGSTGNLYTMNLTNGNNVKMLGTLAANFQGIEKDTDYLVGTTRTHLVYRVTTAGAPTLIRDFGMEGVVSVGDIGWDSVHRVLAVPDVGTNSVYFYKM